MSSVNSLKHKLLLGYKNVDRKLYSDFKLNLNRVLILNKRSRYELEKFIHPEATENELEQIIRKRGSNFDQMFFHHNEHKRILRRIYECFSSYGLEVKAANRTTYKETDVAWADLVVVGGGDGTYLLGASQIRDQNKPIVGFNTDPGRSEGYLCLPKKYSFDVKSAVLKIMKNEFKWLLRSRVEIELKGVSAQHDEIVLDNTKITCAAFPEDQLRNGNICKRVLPTLALNEVFMGERASVKVANLTIRPDGWPNIFVKSSGLCVSTGTGSTGWHMSINRLSKDKIKSLLAMTGQTIKDPEHVTHDYNSSLRFLPDDNRLYWSLREPIYGAVVPDPPHLPTSGFTSCISVTSGCFAGCLVVDGTRYYLFNDGTSAKLYSTPDKRLRTISMD